MNYKEAMKSNDHLKWKEAMDNEMKNIERSKSYVLKKTEHGKKAIGCKWVFKLKLKPDGTVDK